MSDATATPTEETTTEAAAPAAAEGPSKVQLERQKHGPESACQLIGHLGRPTKDSETAIYVEPKQREDGSSTHGHIWGTMAVNRGEGFDPSWVFINIYPVENEAGQRPSPEQMAALAAEMRKGRRVKVQGPIEVRQGATHEVIVDGVAKNIRDTSVTVKLFWDGATAAEDEAGGRPLTFLPRIGNGEGGPDLGF